MSPQADHAAIYRTQAANYDRLIEREDYEGNILTALQTIRPLAGLDAVDFGSGTGRFTRLLAPHVRRIVSLDISPHMLGVNQARMRALPYTNWHLAAGDNVNMPLADDIADVALAGWSFGHTMSWYPESWQARIDRVLAEMARLLRPGGTAIIFETLTTNSATPAPPTEGLRTYYAYLENEHTFNHKWIRTDMRFASPAEAEELIRFFFGDEMGDAVASVGSVIVPECTGIWWRVV